MAGRKKIRRSKGKSRNLYFTLETQDSLIESKNTSKLVDSLMGKRPELRFKFIQEKSQFLDASHLDV